MASFFGGEGKAELGGLRLDIACPVLAGEPEFARAG
jgi:hypothetical protein